MNYLRLLLITSAATTMTLGWASAQGQAPAPQAPAVGAPPAGEAGRGQTTLDIPITDLGHEVYLLGGGSNTVLAVGTDAAIVVDTKTPPYAPLLLQKVASLSSMPVKYVINTHFHIDHTGANEAFAQKGAMIVSTESAAKRMAQPLVNARGGITPPLSDDALPKITFTGQKTISIPGQTAELVSVPPAHTDGDAYVYFREANVLDMGDLHHSNTYPFYDVTVGCKCGSLEGNIHAEELALKVANDTTKIVPGHGPLTTKAELQKYHEMVVMVRDKVDQLIKDGKTEDEVVAAHIITSDNSPLPATANPDAFIRVVYNAEKNGINK